MDVAEAGQDAGSLSKVYRKKRRRDGETFANGIAVGGRM